MVGCAHPPILTPPYKEAVHDPHGSWEDHGGWGWVERWNQALENEIKDRKLGRHLSWVGTNWKWEGCWW